MGLPYTEMFDDKEPTIATPTVTRGKAATIPIEGWRTPRTLTTKRNLEAVGQCYKAVIQLHNNKQYHVHCFCHNALHIPLLNSREERDSL